MCPCLGSVVRRFQPAAKNPHDAAGRVELDDHVGAFVDGPNIVVLVDAHRVSEGPAVEALANFAEEFSVGPEFEQLRRRGSIGRTVGAV
jgi:hypothetical protein